MSSDDEVGVSGEGALPASPEVAPSDESSHSPEAATLRELNLLGRRGHAWLTTKPITRTHLVDWTVKVASAEGVGRLLSLDGANLGYPWVGPWPLGEDSSTSLLHTLSPELLVMVAEHILGPPCLPREHADERPHALDGYDDRRYAYRTTAKYRAWCFQQFLLSCEHVYRTITRDAMELRVEAGARRLACEVSPTVPTYHRLAHTQHLERSAHTTLEFTAFSIALTEGVIKPCDSNSALGQEWGVMHDNLMIGFARMGFRRNALLARALFQSNLAIRHTYMGIHCTIQCMVHGGGGGAILSAFDHTNRTWHYMHVHPANEHDRSGPHLPVIVVHSPKETRVTRYAPPAPYSWLTCLRTCASTHWVVFAGLCVPDAVISRAREDGVFDESQWKGWIAFYNLHTGELQRTIETDVLCGTIMQMWMRVGDDERTLELFALYELPRVAHDLEGRKHNTNMHIVRRTFALDAERRVGPSSGTKTLELHLGEPGSLGRGWRYLVPGEDPNGDGSTWMRANEHGPVTVTRATASAGSGSIVLTMTGDVLAHPTELKSVSECLTVRRVVVVDHTLQVHHIRHTSHRENLSKPVAVISPSGDHVVVTNRWQSPSGGGEHRAFIEVHARRPPAVSPKGEVEAMPGGAFELTARYEIERARLRARSFDVTKLCAFSPCGRFLLLFFENATCAMIDVGECGRHSLLRFRSLCNPAPRFYGNVRRFSNLQWNDSGVWLQTTIHATPQAGTASWHHIHCSVQNLSLY